MSDEAALELELADEAAPDAELADEDAPEPELSKDELDCELAWLWLFCAALAFCVPVVLSLSMALWAATRAAALTTPISLRKSRRPVFTGAVIKLEGN